MRAIDFRGFRFGKIHTSDLNLEVVSTSNRYEARTLPAPTDTVVDIPGSDGQYYFGSIYKNREITCNVAFDSVSEQIYRKIRQLFATDKLQDLVFDEEPYKTWKAKLKSKPEFKSLCFTDKETGQRVYKGDGKLTFICYYPYAFGFDKYVVRAADYYMLNPPECIIAESYSDETFVKNNKDRNYGKILPEDIKYHYNMTPSDYEGGTTQEHIENSVYRDKSHRNKENRGWDPNDDTMWKTGFPTPEQVVAGELYFDTDQGEKTIVDVRGYWDNVPEWQGTAKLLTTPTLDFEQELIYLPQYSKTDFVNMELGFNSSRAMIGSRMLVYNPGDLPVEWELRFDENKRSFWSCRGGTKFRIRRFNVERLPIPCAVDWCGLTTYEAADDHPFKYGNKYFKRRHLNRDAFIKNIEAASSEGTLPEIVKSVEDNEHKTSSAKGYHIYTSKELINKVKRGIIPADKHWNETDWFEESKAYPERMTWYSSEYNYSEAKEHETGDQLSKLEQGHGLKTAINLHLDNWKDILPTETELGLGLSHPKHCYYVEPIPRQRLGHYIKLFYWQTLQWRGNQTPTGEWVNTMNWVDMFPEVFDGLNEQYLKKDGTYSRVDIKQINNPLADFLHMFVTYEMQDDHLTISGIETQYREVYKDLDFEQGIEFANRYDEMFAECIDEMEEYELYWDTLKKLLSLYSSMFEKIMTQETIKEVNGSSIINGKYYLPKGTILEGTIEDRVEKFIDSYINHPTEFINYDLRDLDYDNVIFNGYKMPEWITDDYMEIDQQALSGVSMIKEYLAAVGEDPDGIFSGKRVQFTKEAKDKLEESGNYSKLIRNLEKTIGINGYLNDLLDDYYYLNSDTRMLYTTANPYGAEFVYKPNKVVMNEAITKGKWFKLPPGWSLICIEPMVDESLWGGKRWEDGRPYDWGYGGDVNRNKREVQQLYDFVYDLARDEFFKVYPQDSIKGKIIPETNLQNYKNEDDGINGTEDLKDELLKFKVWYEDKRFLAKQNNNYFAYGYYSKLRNDGEYQFLKIINSIWSVLSPYFKWTSQKGVWSDPDTGAAPQLDDYDITGLPLRCINGDISDWWWYACNYVWANFPPLYWAVADMLNKIKIKYTPLFY